MKTLTKACTVDGCEAERVTRWRCAEHYNRGAVTASCQVCGTSFETPYEGKLYCSGACKQAAVDARRKERYVSKSRGEVVACGHCGEDFKQPKRGVLYCSKVCKQRAAARRAAAKESSRDKNLRVMYKLTPEAFDALFASQLGRCAVCGSSNPGGQGWCVDHDHTCCPRGARTCGECVRGVLCFNCNTQLGKWGDSIEVLRAAIAYLEAYQGRK